MIFNVFFFIVCLITESLSIIHILSYVLNQQPVLTPDIIQPPTSPPTSGIQRNLLVDTFLKILDQTINLMMWNTNFINFHHKT